MPVHSQTASARFFPPVQRCPMAYRSALHAGFLPTKCLRLVEQKLPGALPDLLMREMLPKRLLLGLETGTRVSALDHHAQSCSTMRSEADSRLPKAVRVAIRRRQGSLFAVVGIVFLSNKASDVKSRELIKKSEALFRHARHLLVIDLLPPGNRGRPNIGGAWGLTSPEGSSSFRQAIAWQLPRMTWGQNALPKLALVAVGGCASRDAVMQSDAYLLAPLEALYRAVRHAFPAALKGLLASGAIRAIPNTS